MTGRAGIYVRISQDREGLELGVGRQEEDCRKLADRRGWEVVKVYSDNDRSATSGKRPEWTRLLADLKSGAIDCVAAYSSSRMYRRLKDLLPLLELAKDRGIEIATVASGTINLDTADGRMMANILASVDQAEAERTGERVKRAQRARREQGLSHTGGRALYPFLRQAADMLLDGFSPAAVCRTFSNGEHRSILTSTLRRSLLSRRAVESGAVTAAEQTELRAILGPRGAGRRPGAIRFVLSGIATCGRCGAALRGNGDHYACPPVNGCANLSIKARLLEDAVLDALPATVTLEKAQTAETADALAKLRELEARKDSLGDAFAGGLMTAEQVHRATVTIDREIDPLRDAVAAGMGQDLSAVAKVSPRVLMADPAYRARWESRTLTPAEMEEARAFIRETITITVNPGRRGTFDPSRVAVAAA